MRKLRLGIYRILIVVCFVSFCLGSGCTTLKYVAPVVIKDGIATGGETFELKKRFVLTKVAGFKIDKKNDGSVKASFDSIENADSKAVDALASFAESAMSMAIKTKTP